MTIDARRGWLTFGALVLVGLGIRMPLVSLLPQDFASMRQYHSAMIARAIYFRMDALAGSPARRDAAADYVAQATIPEPSIVERIAAMGYVAAGGERLWIPRALSLVYWTIGAICLYAAGRRWSGQAAGLAAAAVFLFLPYAIGASLSFQPDSLAVMWMCASLAALARYADAATTGQRPLVAAVALAMPAILIRPMTACFLFPVMAVLTWQRTGGTAGSRLTRIAAGLVISAAPAVTYFAYRFLMDPVFTSRVGATFVPSLFVAASFWRGWARFAWLAFGPVLFIGAIAGALFAAPRRTRAALMSLWAGYVLYGAVFNLHISTHPYYQTLAVPMVALSVGALVARFVSGGARSMALAAPAAIAGLLMAMGLWQGVLTPHPDQARVDDYEAIGRATGHSRHVIFLSDNWGVPLRYHADMAGRYWPSSFEISMYRPLGSSGIPDIPAASRLEALGRQMDGAAYFAVTDLVEFDRQSEIRTLLDGRYQIVDHTARYVVYDLGRQTPAR